MKLMAIKVQAQRANGKDIMSVDTAADLCRPNGLGLGRVDTETGEVVPAAATEPSGARSAVLVSICAL